MSLSDTQKQRLSALYHSSQLSLVVVDLQQAYFGNDPAMPHTMANRQFDMTGADAVVAQHKTALPSFWQYIAKNHTAFLRMEEQEATFGQDSTVKPQHPFPGADGKITPLALAGTPSHEIMLPPEMLDDTAVINKYSFSAMGGNNPEFENFLTKTKPDDEPRYALVTGGTLQCVRAQVEDFKKRGITPIVVSDMVGGPSKHRQGFDMQAKFDEQLAVWDKSDDMVVATSAELLEFFGDQFPNPNPASGTPPAPPAAPAP